jgi:hypothetical protein
MYKSVLGKINKLQKKNNIDMDLKRLMPPDLTIFF